MTQTPNNDGSMAAVKRKSTVTWSDAGPVSHARMLVNEVPVAIVFNGTTAAVMMASPVDIAAFALGFALTEGYIFELSHIENFEEIVTAQGIEARFWVSALAAEKISERRRTALGPMGCGLCGIDSLGQALRTVPHVADGPVFTASEISQSCEDIKAFQPLHDQTRSAHAAGFIVPKQGVIFAKEDVGRHNALDKLCGTLASQKVAPQSGAIIMTSRLSVDLVQKTAMMKCAILIGVSAPSSLAVEVAESVGMTLIAFCRHNSFEVFTGKQRVSR
jgi:FdhD protein